MAMVMLMVKMRDKSKLKNERKTAAVKHAKIAVLAVNGTVQKLLDGIKQKYRANIKIGDAGAIHAVDLLIMQIEMQRA